MKTDHLWNNCHVKRCRFIKPLSSISFLFTLLLSHMNSEKFHGFLSSLLFIFYSSEWCNWKGCFFKCIRIQSSTNARHSRGRRDSECIAIHFVLWTSKDIRKHLTVSSDEKLQDFYGKALKGSTFFRNVWCRRLTHVQSDSTVNKPFRWKRFYYD